MKELISIINDKLFKVIEELKEQKSTLETKLASIKDEIDNKVKVASEYKDNVEKSNNIISDLESKTLKLKQDLQELHDKFEAAGFIELIEAGNKEINGKIIEYNSKIDAEQENINKLQDEASNLKDELITLKDSKENIENELHNTIIALNYYSSKIDEMTLFATENSDKLDEFTEEDDSNISTDDIDVEKIIDGTIFEEIDSITTEDKDLSDEDIENILNSDDEDKKEEVKEEVKEEDLSVTQELNDVINQTNELILNETVLNNAEEEKFLSQLNEDEEEKNDLVKLDLSALDDNNEEEDKTEETQEESNDIDVDSVLREIGLDPSSFVEDTSKLSHINVNNATKIINTLDKHFIDINNIYAYPSILMTIKDDVLNNILNKLEELGCIPSTITYIFKYLDKIDLDKLLSYNGQTTSIINVLDDVIPEMDKKDIVKEIGLTEQEGEVLKSKLTEEELDVMNTFPEIVKTNYNTLKSLNINELNKCFTEHPKRFMDNPDIFESMLDKYDPEDLIRCINKNVAVIDKL